MINPKAGELLASSISATISEGFAVTTADGRPARLAVVDDAGNIVEAGPQVAQQAWAVCIQAQQNFWRGEGHLRVLSKPAEPIKKDAAA